MKLQFAIIGHGQAPNEVEFIEWLQDMVKEYNRRHTTKPRFNDYRVLVREDEIPD